MVEINKIHTYTGHKGAVYSIERGATSNIFYSSGADGQIIEWDLNNLENGRLIAKLPTSVYALRFIPMYNTLVIGQNFEGIHLIDVSNRKEIGSLKTTQSQIFDIQMIGDGILIGTGDGCLIEVGLNDLKIRKQVTLSEVSLRTIAVMAGGNEIACGFSDNSFRIVDSQDFEVKKVNEGHEKSIFSGVFSPDNKLYLTGSRDAHLKFWDVDQNYTLKQSIVAHMYAINHISFHPNGEYFATASMDKTIKIWNYERRKLLKVIDKARHNGHLTSVNKLYWSDFNNYLISASDDRSLSVWDIKVTS
ncbi:WD40 repeat domain-containing protein [Reichenbachiella sp. MALMAid0571]|uniref:WD40 repeat domain-containing protein n=1 Tax=Reichenbachiella sp. MALMAid0571 TaxID=3143939 RepID=UPI0032DE76DD